ncbi:MAG: SHOCT domain-containing protein [Solirubrobacteraceae bacterium]
MPGLLRGLARTAVVAGTATAVSNRVSRRQYNKWADQDTAQYQEQAPAPAPAAPAPAAPASSGDDTLTQLQKLADLKSQGILTDEEFAAQKARILGS